jgi:hypothetical protein
MLASTRPHLMHELPNVSWITNAELKASRDNREAKLVDAFPKAGGHTIDLAKRSNARR